MQNCTILLQNKKNILRIKANALELIECGVYRKVIWRIKFNFWMQFSFETLRKLTLVKVLNSSRDLYWFGVGDANEVKFQLQSLRIKNFNCLRSNDKRQNNLYQRNNVYCKRSIVFLRNET